MATPGDLGRFDADGFLTIIGQKKEIIITAGGKNIAPKNIEAALKNLLMVNEAVVIGDRRRFLSALLTLDPEAAEAYASDNGIGLDDVPTHPALVAKLQKGIDDDVNSQFARVEYIRKFTVLPRNFTVDDGKLTPSLKIKRRAVDANWSEAIEAMYDA